MGGIPLAALAIRPPEQQPSAISQLAQYAQLKDQLQNAPLRQQAMQQQVQAGAQENQIRDQQLKDQQATTKALQSWDGKDVHDLPGLLLKNGGSAQAVFGMKSQMLEQQKTQAGLDETTLKNNASRNDLISGHLEAVKGLPSEQRPQAYTAAIQDLEQKGIVKPGTIAPEYPGDDKLDLFEKSFMGQKQITDNAIKERETKAKELEAQARTQAAQNTSDRLKAELPGGPLQPVEQKELSDYQAKNPGKGPIDFAKYKASLAPQATMNVQMSAGGGLSKEALDQQAENYYNTGKLPPARGAAGIAQNRQIMNRTAELHSGESLSAGSSEYKANSDSLKKLQGNLDSVSAFENTAVKNLDMFTGLAKKAIDTGIPLLNAPLRSAAAGLGSEDQAALNAARQVAINEIAKVTSSPGLSGQLSDSARHEVEAFNPANATYGQTLKVAQTLKQDMANRHESYADQIRDIKQRLGDKKATGETSGSSSNSAPAANDWASQFGGVTRKQ